MSSFARQKEKCKNRESGSLFLSSPSHSELLGKVDHGTRVGGIRFLCSAQARGGR